jgi:hypothetical protein
VLAHAHHAGLGNGRFGQRRQHGGRHARGSAIALRALGVIEVDAVTARARARASRRPMRPPPRIAIFEEACSKHGKSFSIRTRNRDQTCRTKPAAAPPAVNSPRQHDLDRVRGAGAGSALAAPGSGSAAWARAAVRRAEDTPVSSVGHYSTTANSMH